MARHPVLGAQTETWAWRKIEWLSEVPPRLVQTVFNVTEDFAPLNYAPNVTSPDMATHTHTHPHTA